MSGLVTQLKKELLSHAVSPVSWIIAVLFYVFRGGELSGQLAAFSAMRMDANQLPGASYSTSSTFIMVVLVPGVLTMRCFADERRSGSLETLMTAPVRDWEIVVGKWLGASVFFAALWLPSVLILHLLEYPSYLDVDIAFGPVFSAYFGMFLLSGMLLAFGVFASSLTDNVLLAAILTILFTLGLSQLPSWIAAVFGTDFDNYYARELMVKCDVFGNFSNWFARGVIDTSQVVFYLGGIAFFLALTGVNLSSRRLA